MALFRLKRGHSLFDSSSILVGQLWEADFHPKEIESITADSKLLARAREKRDPIVVAPISRISSAVSVRSIIDLFLLSEREFCNLPGGWRTSHATDLATIINYVLPAIYPDCIAEFYGESRNGRPVIAIGSAED